MCLKPEPLTPRPEKDGRNEARERQSPEGSPRAAEEAVQSGSLRVTRLLQVFGV